MPSRAADLTLCITPNQPKETEKLASTALANAYFFLLEEGMAPRPGEVELQLRMWTPEAALNVHVPPGVFPDFEQCVVVGVVVACGGIWVLTLSWSW